eukprot:gene10143-7100_t
MSMSESSVLGLRHTTLQDCLCQAERETKRSQREQIRHFGGISRHCAVLGLSEPEGGLPVWSTSALIPRLQGGIRLRTTPIYRFILFTQQE